MPLLHRQAVAKCLVCDTAKGPLRAIWEGSDTPGCKQGRSLRPRPSGQRNDAYHAYSHVNTLGGAGAAYLVKGDPRYLDMLINAYDSLQANQVFATGGYGPDEQFLPRDRLRECLENTANTFETQCGTWAGFKMVKHLLCATGEAKYGDWVELPQVSRSPDRAYRSGRLSGRLGAGAGPDGGRRAVTRLIAGVTPRSYNG